MRQWCLCLGRVAVLPKEEIMLEDPSFVLGSNHDGTATPIGFQSNSEMGPVADMSTFPPTMAPTSAQDDSSGMLSMDSILSTGFWDSVLVPGQ